MNRTERLANQKIKKLKKKQARLTRDFAKEISKLIQEIYIKNMKI